MQLCHVLQHSVKGIDRQNEVEVPVVKANLCLRQDRHGCTNADENERQQPKKAGNHEAFSQIGLIKAQAPTFQDPFAVAIQLEDGPEQPQQRAQCDEEPKRIQNFKDEEDASGQGGHNLKESLRTAQSRKRQLLRLIMARGHLPKSFLSFRLSTAFLVFSSCFPSFFIIISYIFISFIVISCYFIMLIPFFELEAIQTMRRARAQRLQ